MNITILQYSLTILYPTSWCLSRIFPPPTLKDSHSQLLFPGTGRVRVACSSCELWVHYHHKRQHIKTSTQRQIPYTNTKPAERINEASSFLFRTTLHNTTRGNEDLLNDDINLRGLTSLSIVTGNHGPQTMFLFIRPIQKVMCC